jgi:polyisoprenoid-binding protein YceI
MIQLKTFKSIALVAITLLSFSFIKDAKESKKVNTAESSIFWIGKKITGQHSGNLSIKEGVLEFDNDKLSGGSIVVDMTSLIVTDLEGKAKANLEGHLNSDDFFGVSSHETATLVLDKVTLDNDTYKVVGSFTIKGITKSIDFDMTIADNVAKSSLKIDRTLFGIRYGSASFFDNLKNKAIDNMFELEVTLKL